MRIAIQLWFCRVNFLFQEAAKRIKHQARANRLRAYDRRPVFEQLDVRMVMTVSAPMPLPHNDQIPYDVDGSGQVEPIDVLIILNAINDTINRSISSPTQSNVTTISTQYLDVDGNQVVDGNDVILVANYINSHPVPFADQSNAPIATTSPSTAGAPTVHVPALIQITPPQSSVATVEPVNATTVSSGTEAQVSGASSETTASTSSTSLSVPSSSPTNLSSALQTTNSNNSLPPTVAPQGNDDGFNSLELDSSICPHILVSYPPSQWYIDLCMGGTPTPTPTP
ncbi:MAG: dockerin type I domain-containing protein, partial [Pirellula sp.]